MSVAQAKVPAVVASSLIFLVLGAAGGSLATHAFGDPWEAKKPVAASDGGGATAEGRQRMQGQGGGQGAPGGNARRGPGGPGGPGGGAPGGRGGRGPSAKAQLATLLAKLDVLTAKPLAVTLTPEQKKKAAEILKDVDKGDLSDEDAQKRLDELLALLKDQQTTLEEAGYRWPGQQGGPGGLGGQRTTPVSNPFQGGDGAKHLKDLRARLGT